MKCCVDDGSAVGNMSSSSSVFSHEACASLTPVLMSDHSETRTALSAFCYLSEEVCGIFSASLHLKMFSQVTDGPQNDITHSLGPVMLLSLRDF